MKVRSNYLFELSNLPKVSTDVHPDFEPDGAFTVQELLYKYSSGGIPAISKTLLYDDNPDIDNPDPTFDPDFDLADYAERLDDLNESIRKKTELRKQQRLNAHNARVTELESLRRKVKELEEKKTCLSD